MEQPTITLKIGPSHFALDERGEVMETVDVLKRDAIDPPWEVPDWRNAGICDPRGSGSREGFMSLRASLLAAERCAELSGTKVLRLPRP